MGAAAAGAADGAAALPRNAPPPKRVVADRKAEVALGAEKKVGDEEEGAEEAVEEAG